MGAVYEAVHKRLRNQRFAIKVLHAKMVENEKIFARFQREAEIATAVGHPSIVYVLDFYETDDGRPCMVMEFLEGEDLGQRLDREERIMPREEVLRIMEQVGGALQAVHDKGVIHRDMKPANIFLAEDENGQQRIKVLDFGISKMKDSNTKLTGDHSVLGTPHYMSPEQGEGQVKDVDHRTDIFALGTICYQMLSGTIPFDGPTLPGVIYKICHMEPEPITDKVEDLPEAVHRVLLKALAKKREDRYQRAMDFVGDLKAALQGGEDRASVAADEPEPVTRKTAILEDGDAPGVGGQTLADEVHEVGDLGEAPGVSETAATLVSPDASVKKTLTVAETASEEAARLGTEPTLLKDGGPATLNTLSDTAGEQAAAAPPAPAKGRGWMAGAAIGVVLLVVGLVMALRYQGAVDTPVAGTVKTAAKVPPAKAPVPTAETPAPATAPSPPAAPREVRVTLKLTPPGALVRLDGRLRKDNPLVLVSGKAYHLRVEAPGHVAQERELRVKEAQNLEIALAAKQAPVAARQAPVARKKAPRKRSKGTRKDRPAKAMPFAGDLDDGAEAQPQKKPAKKKPRRKKPPKKKRATPFSGEL